MLTVLQPHELTPMEGLDHLFLLPERVLEMDTKNLQKDLAGLDFDARLLHEAPMGNVWLSGSRPSSATRDDTMHWFAHLGPHSSSNAEDKEARIKTFKERQNEERQKKLDEMKNQALAAQRFKEQKEHERRQRLEELRVKEDERRQQVEERKKAINDAERDRLESILKRNQDREARIDAKRRNDMKSSLVFAFGSSTPRKLGPADNSSSFWGHRKATSTQNITYSPTPLTRRQSERELDGGSKKRATSAGGIERSGEDMRMSTSMYAVFNWEDEPDSSKSPISNYPAQAISSKTTTNFGIPQHPAGCISGYMGRRRTDLMPTIPAKESPSTPPRKPFMRSPGPSRPSSSLSQQSTSSVTSSVIMRSRPATAPRYPRPASIAVTGITNDVKNGTDFKKPDNKPPLPKVRKSSLVKSQEKIGKKRSLVSPTEGSPKTILSPTTATTVTSIENLIDITPTQSSVNKEETSILINVDENKLIVNGQPHSDVETPNNNQNIEQLIEIDQHPPSDVIEDIQLELENINLTKDEKGDIEKEVVTDNVVKNEGTDSSILAMGQIDFFENQNNEVDMASSMSSKPRITTEEEAKAALAERRRIAREEAEKQAELERLRIEEETRLEIERQHREEEQQRQLIELQRAAEEERLKEAIREAQRREEEEKLRREEELKVKILKEEAERKAREEAERQKAELQERLKNEEKEREARRKRVEAIMLRTRGKNNSNTIPQTEEKNVENKFDSKVNGSKTGAEENGHNNGKEIETVDNIIPVDTIKNANTVNVTALSTDDTLNSNDAWQRNSQTDLLM